MSTHRVVIVGGGFGGVKAALELAEDKRFDITLISDIPDFRIYGELYRVSTGAAERTAKIPLAEVFEGKGVEIVISRASKIDRQKHMLTTASGKQYPYDALILGLGVNTNYFGIPGLKKFSYGIKSVDDAEELKLHLHKQLLDEKKPDFHYVVVGGGPTGIELAGRLPYYLKKIMKQHGMKPRKVHVDLIEAAPRLLPRMPKHMSRRVARNLRRRGVRLYLKTAVQAQTADALMVNNKPIRSHTVIWTAGVTNNPFFTENGFQMAHNGRARVDQFLQAEAGVYVVGDNADTPYAGMAQTALHDGKYVARNLIRLADKKDVEPYHAKKPIYVFPAGRHWAAVLWGPFTIYGWVGGLLRVAADLIAYHDYEPWHLATRRWMAKAVEEESCKICQQDPIKIEL